MENTLFLQVKDIGYGYYDLFVSKRLDDSWTNWIQNPENLGNIINSPGYELKYFSFSKGDKAYVGREQDIWEIDKYCKTRSKVALVKGKVYDSKKKKSNECLQLFTTHLKPTKN